MSPEYLSSQAVQIGSESAGASTPVASPEDIAVSSVANSPAKRLHLHKVNGANLRGTTSDTQSIDVEEIEQWSTQSQRKDGFNIAPSLPKRLQAKGTDDPHEFSSEEQDTSQDESEVEVPNKSTDQGLETTFLRAASLL